MATLVMTYAVMNNKVKQSHFFCKIKINILKNAPSHKEIFLLGRFYVVWL